ncbi:hypothetical protein APHAL10511_007735 [Amanita phalloides]|nr:hypothetical protein APHAL10511_007735 [Amanita phalloides]
MRPILSVAVALLAASAALAQNSFTINTPTNAVVCQPLLLAWQGGTRPYFLVVLSGNDPTGQALEDLGQQNGTSLTWLVNQPAGTALGLTLRDSTGLVAQTASFTVNPGSDSSCLGKAASTSAGGKPGTASSGTSNSATSAATSPATTPAGSSPTGTSRTSGGTSVANTASSGTSAASATSTKNAALANAAQVGSVGIFGAALVALLA